MKEIHWEGDGLLFRLSLETAGWGLLLGTSGPGGTQGDSQVRGEHQLGEGQGGRGSCGPSHPRAGGGHLCPPESVSHVLGQCRTDVIGGCLSTPRLHAGPVVSAGLPMDTLRIPEVTNNPRGKKPWRPHEGPVLTRQAISLPEPQSISFLSKVLARKPPSCPRDQLHLTGLLCTWPFL